MPPRWRVNNKLERGAMCAYLRTIYHSNNLQIITTKSNFILVFKPKNLALYEIMHGDSLLHVSICCTASVANILSPMCFLRGPKIWKPTGHHIANWTWDRSWCIGYFPEYVTSCCAWFICNPYVRGRNYTLFFTPELNDVCFMLCMGVKLGCWHCGRKGSWGCLRTRCWGEYLDLGGTR